MSQKGDAKKLVHGSPPEHGEDAFKKTQRCEEECQKAPIDAPDVHSINKWEEASFKDGSRKAKFLRLLGGDKKEHTGRFVCGEKKFKPDSQQEITRKADEHLEEKLETQYEKRITEVLHKHGQRHLGFGADNSLTSRNFEKQVHDVKSDGKMRFVASHDDDDNDKKRSKNAHS